MFSVRDTLQSLNFLQAFNLLSQNMENNKTFSLLGDYEGNIDQHLYKYNCKLPIDFTKAVPGRVRTLTHRNGERGERTSISFQFDIKRE